jgi:hypothetical protein
VVPVWSGIRRRGWQRATIGALFKFLLMLEDGEPNDPAALVTAVPNWTVCETFSTGRGHEWRILAIDENIVVTMKALAKLRTIRERPPRSSSTSTPRITSRRTRYRRASKSRTREIVSRVDDWWTAWRQLFF